MSPQRQLVALSQEAAARVYARVVERWVTHHVVRVAQHQRCVLISSRVAMTRCTVSLTICLT